MTPHWHSAPSSLCLLCDSKDLRLPAKWVTAEEVYGEDPSSGHRLQQQCIGDVLALFRNQRIPTRWATSAGVLAAAAPAPA